MHPGFHGWWRSRHGWPGEPGHHACAPAGCGPGGWREPSLEEVGRLRDAYRAWTGPGFDEGGVFGVRRPLRFLAYKLELNEAQVATFAAILDQLKTERAQAAVDHRRRISGLAEALESASFDDARVAALGEEQQRSDERVRNAVAQALRQMHAALDDEQRKRLAYLLRTGALSI